MLVSVANNNEVATFTQQTLRTAVHSKVRFDEHRAMILCFLIAPSSSIMSDILITVPEQ